MTGRSLKTRIPNSVAPSVVAVLLAVALLLLPTEAWSQASGQLAGTVTDESGSVLPGVTVTVTNPGTNQSRVLTTGDDGYFAAPLLPPGDYNVTATLDGFNTLTREGVRVTAAETSRINLQLAIGKVTEVMTVTGDAPLIETSNATLGVVIDEQTIVDLPLNGRNFTQLGTLTPGVVAPPALFGGGDGDADAGINGFGPTTSGFSVNGVRSQSNNFLLDGSSNNDTFNTGFVLRPPPDAIEEFKILTHSYSAEFGRNAGSVVNVVTKSGSNNWNASAWWFNRDDSNEERNFFSPADQPKPTLEQDQFGGAIGGALMQDKLFGFAYYDGFRNIRGTTRNLAVLTAAQRAGDFSGSAAIIDPLTGLPFPGNVIPADRLNASAQQFINDFMPLPNSGANRFITSPDATDDRDQFGLRLDYRINESNNLLARYLTSSSDREIPAVVEPIGTTASSQLDDIMLSHTAMISSTTFNQVRFAQNEIDASPTVTSGIQNSEYGLNVPNLNDLAVGLARITVSGFPNLGDRQQPFVKRENKVVQLTDDFSWLKGRHAMKFGVDWRKEEMFIGFINRPNGDFSFNGRFTGNAAADFLLGLPVQFRQASPGADAINEGEGTSWAVYAQDEFRVSANVTLNLGLRYELNEPFVDSGDGLNSFRPGQQSTRFPDAPTGLVYPGDAGVPRGTYDTDRNNLAPRIAVAWDPQSNGRSSVRAGWGIFYDSLPGQGDFFQNAVLAPPFNPLLQIDAGATPDLSFNDPLASLTGGAVGFPPGIIFLGWGSEFTTPSYQHYNLTYQRQFGNNIAAEVGYVGSRGKNLPIFIETNPFTVIDVDGTATRGPRLFPAFSLVRPTFTVAESWYDSIQTSVRMRPTNGLNFLASYTYSDAEDHDSALNVGGGEERRPILAADQNDPASIRTVLDRERGQARFDVKHRWVLSFGYELPGFEKKAGAMKALLGGWQVNGIAQMQTGFPFQIRTRSSNIQGLSGRPDLICDPNAGPGTTAEWFDTSCFVELPRAATALRQGNMGRNVVRGPGFERVDLSLFKNIFIKGDHRLQLRIEAFNAFNKLNLGTPGFRMGTSSFGRITSTNGDGRIIQLGLKYNR
ncbi:MAG: TonB-dependent receptor [Acidobacteria bacterium]|nr:TonB-dependent receptor [Acidobacteriota bacterium]